MGRSLPVYVAILSLGVCGFICVWKYCSRSVSAVLAAFLVAAMCLSIVLNPETIDRASYFVPIAIFSASAVFFSKVRHLMVETDISRRLIALALLFVLVSILIEGANTRLIGAVDYYHVVDEDAANALNWIRDETPKSAVVFTNFASLGTWIEGYANRKALAPRPLGLIVTKPDFEDSLAANRIDAGNYIVENGYFLVSDYFPAGYNNPGISVKRGDQYEPIIFLDDEHQSFTFSFANDTTIRESNMLSANKTIVGFSVEPSVVTITYKYSWNFGTILRRVELSKKAQASVTYDIALVDCSIKEFNLTAMVYSANQVRSHATDGKVMNLTVSTADGNEENISLSPRNSSGSLVAIYDASVLSSAIFVLDGSTSQMSITLELGAASVNDSNSDAQFTNSIDLLKNYNISYLLLDKRNYSQWIRFTKGFDGLTNVFESERILILKVEDYNIRF
jgi:hypothetical protein